MMRRFASTSDLTKAHGGNGCAAVSDLQSDAKLFSPVPCFTPCLQENYDTTTEGSVGEKHI